MRAMTVTAYGPPEVLKLQEMPTPVPGEEDLLVEVVCGGMNPVSFKMRMAPRWGERKMPFVLGFDASGVVRGMGANVKGFNVGDEVFASPNLKREGADAEYVCVDYRSAAMKPRTVDHAHAAAIPLAGLTAWEALHNHGQVKPGEWVLIHAGAGGVGHLAIQLAKIHGCKVITTAGRDETIAVCKSLGADEVIDYKRDDIVQRVTQVTAGKLCPVVFDTVGGETFNLSLRCLAFYGRVVTIVPGIPTDHINSLFARSASVHLEYMGIPTMFNVDPQRQGQTLAKLAALVDSGRLKPIVSRRVKLEDLAEAHRMQESGRTIGKIVIDVK
jgi:NADPH2:quinone reductase